MTTPNRRSFLKYAGAGTGAMMLGGLNLSALAAESTVAGKSVTQDIAILNYALTLEYLEAEFYNAFNTGPLAAKLTIARVKEYAKELASHENEHVAALIATIGKLGGAPVPKPKITFAPLIGDGSGVNDQVFLQLAAVFEPVGVRAYLGQADKVQNKDVLTAAASILAVEANHTSGIQELRRQLGYNTAPTRQTGIAPQPGTDTSVTDSSKFDVNFSPTPTDFWKPLDMATVLKIVGPLLPA